MGHQIVEAILEDGQIVSVNRKLPRGKMKVHLIYDTEGTVREAGAEQAVAETSGIYQGIDAEAEARKLRTGWERNVDR